MRNAKRLISGIAGCFLTAVSLPSLADVTVQESVSVNGSGLMSFANLNGKSTTLISGSKARMESDVQMQSRLVRLFAGGPTAEITQLDEDQVFELDLKKKQYTQTSLSARRAEMEKAMQQRNEQAGQSQQPGSPVDQSQCEWSQPTADVKKTGEKTTIAGFSAEHTLITVTQSCKNKDTGEVCDFGLALDQWLAPKFDGSAERQAFYQRYAEKMGLGSAASRDFAQNAQAMFAGYKDLWAEVAKKAGKLDGYPVRSTFALAVGGAQCTSQQQAGNAAAAGSPAKEALAAAGQIGSAIGGLFGKKKDSAAATPPPAAAPTLLVNGMVPLMTVSSELLSISHDTIAAEQFAPPADFKKVEK